MAEGVSALYAAAANGHAQGDGHLRCVEILLAAGADVEALSIKGWRPLMGASVADIDGPESSERALGCLRALIAAGADLDAQDEQGCTAAMWAIYEGEPRMARILAEAGADMEIEDRVGHGALWFAEVRGDQETASFIRGSVEAAKERRELSRAAPESVLASGRAKRAL